MLKWVNYFYPKKFVAARKKSFVRAAQNYLCIVDEKFAKKFLCVFCLSFSAKFRTLKPVRWARMSCEQLHFVHLTAVNTKNILKNDQNSFVRPAQNNFCEPQENKVPLATFFLMKFCFCFLNVAAKISFKRTNLFHNQAKTVF